MTPTLNLVQRGQELWRKLQPSTRLLIGFALLNIVLVNLTLTRVFSTDRKQTVLHHTSWAVRAVEQEQDSWLPMMRALNYLEQPHEQPVYDAIFFQEKLKFQYPLTSLLPLHLMGEVMGTPSKSSVLRVLKYLSWLMLAGTVACTLRIYFLSLQQQKIGTSRWDTAVALVALTCLAYTFYPLVKAYTLGQVQVWINFGFSAAFLCYFNGRKGLSGVLAGLMCLFKPQYALFLVWGLWRRQWGFVSGFAAASLAGVAAALVLYGWNDNVPYLGILRFISLHGESYFPNQSANGALHRLLMNGNNLIWNGQAFPPYNPWVYFGTLASSLTLVIAALTLPARAQLGKPIDLAIFGLTCTLASPIAWEHHHGILLPLYAFVVPQVLAMQGPGRRVSQWVVAGSYFLSSNFFFWVQATAATHFNFLQSYLLFGALLLLAMLYYLAGSQKTTSDSPAAVGEKQLQLKEQALW